MLSTSARARSGPSRRGGPTRRPSPCSPGAAKWSKDGKAIYYITDRGSEFRRLARHDLVTGADAVLSGSIPWDIEEFDQSDDGTLIAAVANEDGSDVLHAIVAATGVESTAPVFPPARSPGSSSGKGRTSWASPGARPRNRPTRIRSISTRTPYPAPAPAPGAPAQCSSQAVDRE